MKRIQPLAGLVLVLALTACQSTDRTPSAAGDPPVVVGHRQLGAFSVSLAVKDLQASRAFYEKLGFQAFGGQGGQKWLILRSGNCVIGLFEGMFERNILTFNPGWDQGAGPLDGFEDVRAIQARLLAGGLQLQQKAAAGSGPAHITLVDPDGNPVLIDQHVPAPGTGR